MTGKTAMEIFFRVVAETHMIGKRRHIALSYLAYVALDANLKPRNIARVIAETDEEKRRNGEG